MKIIPIWWLPDWLALIIFVLCALAVIVSFFDRDQPEEYSEDLEIRDLRLRLLAEDWKYFRNQEAYFGGPEADYLNRLQEFVQMAEEFGTLASELTYEDLQRFAEQDHWAWNSQEEGRPVSTEFLLARNARLREFIAS